MKEIINRKANFDYFVVDTIECGVSLLGNEVKSIRLGNCNLKDSYALIRNNEVFLINMFIAKYKDASLFAAEERRKRKLLLHKKEILKLNDKVTKEGYTLVPLKLYFVKNKVKILLGVCKGKKNYDKRNAIKDRDLQKEAMRTLKSI